MCYLSMWSHFSLLNGRAISVSNPMRKLYLITDTHCDSLVDLGVAISATKNLLYPAWFGFCITNSNRRENFTGSYQSYYWKCIWFCQYWLCMRSGFSIAQTVKQTKQNDVECEEKINVVNRLISAASFSQYRQHAGYRFSCSLFGERC